MYELLCRSSQRPWAPQPEKLVAVPDKGNSKPLILHMQENRSHLTQDARVCFSAIALLFMVTSIAPALQGHWLVPAFSILALAGLTFALEGMASPGLPAKRSNLPKAGCGIVIAPGSRSNCPHSGCGLPQRAAVHPNCACSCGDGTDRSNSGAASALMNAAPLPRW
jgi:hypothetical protein